MTNARATDLIRRYLLAVERALPQRLRSDVTREIASLIEDKLDERSTLDTRTEPMVVDVLAEMGDPGEVARRFDPHPRYLVGPELYPLFERIAKIILAGALGIALLATYVPRLVAVPPAQALLSLGALGQLAQHYYHLVLALLAQLVITFYILERFRVKVPDFTGPFDPRELPELPEHETETVTFVDFAGRVGGLTVVAVLVNLTPNIFLGLGTGRASLTSLAEFGIVLPVMQINAWILLGLGLAFVARSVGRWTVWLRVLDLTVSLFGVYVLYALVDGSMVHAPASLPQLAPVARILGGILPYLPVFALVMTFITSFGVIHGFVRRAKRTTPEVK